MTSYEEIFKTGYTFEVAPTCAPNHVGNHVIFLASYEELRHFSGRNDFIYDAGYDGSNKLVSTYNINKCNVLWYWQNTLLPYCTNEIRGKKILMNLYEVIDTELKITDERKSEFISKFLTF